MLHPILRFYNQIAANSGIQKINVNEGVVELDEAARMLNVLIDEVHALELDNYVQKTKRQEAELGFAQQQIRPHFFINCLNVIYLSLIHISNSVAASAGPAMTVPQISIRMAIAFVALLPILIIYPFLQKYFAEGIALGAVKG